MFSAAINNSIVTSPSQTATIKNQMDHPSIFSIKNHKNLDHFQRTQTVQFQGVYELSDTQRNNPHDPSRYSKRQDNLIITRTKNYGLTGRHWIQFHRAGQRVTNLQAKEDALDSEVEDQETLDKAADKVYKAQVYFNRVINQLKARAIAPVLLERRDGANRQ